MVVKILGKQLDITPSIKTYINQKLEGARKLIVKFDAENVVAMVEIARTTRHHRSGDVYRAEINLSLPGKLLRAEATTEDIRIAIGEASRELEREIKAYKAKNQTIRRKARKVKDE